MTPSPEQERQLHLMDLNMWEIYREMTRVADA